MGLNHSKHLLTFLVWSQYRLDLLLGRFLWEIVRLMFCHFLSRFLINYKDNLTIFFSSLSRHAFLLYFWTHSLIFRLFTLTFFLLEWFKISLIIWDSIVCRQCSILEQSSCIFGITLNLIFSDRERESFWKDVYRLWCYSRFGNVLYREIKLKTVNLFYLRAKKTVRVIILHLKIHMLQFSFKKRVIPIL